MDRKKGKIGLMTASFVMMSFLTPNSVLARIAESFPGTSLETVQMVTTMPSLIAIGVALLIGKMTPYFYKKTLILISECFYLAGGLFPYFFHQRIAFLLLGAAILGIGLGIMLICVAALICDCYDEKESSRLMGIQAAFISGGGMVFLWLGGQLGRRQWEHCFLAYLLVFAILAVDLFCLPKGKLDGKRTKGEARQPVPKEVWFYAILGFFVYLFITVYQSNVPMLVEIRSMGGPAESSYASMSYTFAGMVAGCLTGRIIGKIGRRIFPAAVLLAMAGMTLGFFSGQLWMLCLAGMFGGAAFSTFTPAGNFYAALRGKDRNRSVCIAVFTSFSNFGQAVSPLVIGVLMRPFSIEQRFLGAAAAFVVLFAAAAWGTCRKP